MSVSEITGLIGIVLLGLFIMILGGLLPAVIILYSIDSMFKMFGKDADKLVEKDIYLPVRSANLGESEWEKERQRQEKAERIKLAIEWKKKKQQIGEIHSYKEWEDSLKIFATDKPAQPARRLWMAIVSKVKCQLH